MSFGVHKTVCIPKSATISSKQLRHSTITEKQTNKNYVFKSKFLNVLDRKQQPYYKAKLHHPFLVA